MTPEQKQSALQRLRAILLATLDYLIAVNGGSIVFDNEDFIVNHYEQQRLKVEENYRKGNADWLQKEFARLTKGLQNRGDQNYAGYIKEKTGYDVDIFDDLPKRIVAPKSERVEVINKVEKEGIEEVTVLLSSGPAPKHFDEQVVISPDGKRKLRVVQWSHGENATTYVEIAFPTASGAVYGISGIQPGVKASWKNNSTIVIEIPKEQKANTQYRQVRSYEDVIAIEYVEC